MMDFMVLMEHVLAESVRNPYDTVYVWINFDGEKDNWAVDTNPHSLGEAPTLFYRPGMRL